jgi:hypothetical protein
MVLKSQPIVEPANSNSSQEAPRLRTLQRAQSQFLQLGNRGRGGVLVGNVLMRPSLEPSAAVNYWSADEHAFQLCWICRQDNGPRTLSPIKGGTLSAAQASFQLPESD